jgi:hypothetical protein
VPAAVEDSQGACFGNAGLAAWLPIATGTG